MYITARSSGPGSALDCAALPGPAAAAQPDATPRLLSYRTLKAALGRFGLPSYSALLAYLKLDTEDARVYALACNLNRLLFPDLPALDGVDEWEAEFDFLNRVCTRLFPLSDYTDELAHSAGEHPLSYYIWYECHGIPWETGDEMDIDAHVWPLAALVIPALTPARGFELAAVRQQDTAEEWCMEHGVMVEQYEYYLNYGTVHAELAALDPPLNGLATVYRCLVRNSGNPFIDDVEYYGDEFNDDPDGFWLQVWDVDAVRALAYEYDLVREDLEHMRAYHEWFDHTPDAAAQVLAALSEIFPIRLEEEERG